MIKVVAALITKDNKVLLAKRATGDNDVLAKWEFPGGKVELNETQQKAIEREIKEEFEIEIKAKKFVVSNVYKYSNKIVELNLYYCEYISGNIVLHDHLEYKWVKPEDILSYDLAAADIKLAKYINENIIKL